jgi:hypothetical protein
VVAPALAAVSRGTIVPDGPDVLPVFATAVSTVPGVAAPTSALAFGGALVEAAFSSAAGVSPELLFVVPALLFDVVCWPHAASSNVSSTTPVIMRVHRVNTFMQNSFQEPLIHQARFCAPMANHSLCMYKSRRWCAG